MRVHWCMSVRSLVDNLDLCIFLTTECPFCNACVIYLVFLLGIFLSCPFCVFSLPFLSFFVSRFSVLPRYTPMLQTQTSGGGSWQYYLVELQVCVRAHAALVIKKKRKSTQTSTQTYTQANTKENKHEHETKKGVWGLVVCFGPRTPITISYTVLGV